jgi:hypothetical protein
MLFNDNQSVSAWVFADLIYHGCTNISPNISVNFPDFLHGKHGIWKATSKLLVRIVAQKLQCSAEKFITPYKYISQAQ